jgi:hypothetical protein
MGFWAGWPGDKNQRTRATCSTVVCPCAAAGGRAARASVPLAVAQRGQVGERRIRRDQRQEFSAGITSWMASRP